MLHFIKPTKTPTVNAHEQPVEMRRESSLKILFASVETQDPDPRPFTLGAAKALKPAAGPRPSHHGTANTRCWALSGRTDSTCLIRFDLRSRRLMLENWHSRGFITSFKCLCCFFYQRKRRSGFWVMEIPYTAKVFHSTSCYCTDIPPIPICIPLHVSDQPVHSSTASLWQENKRTMKQELENLGQTSEWIYIIVNLLSIGTRLMSSDLTLCLCLKERRYVDPPFATDAESMQLIQESRCDFVLLMWQIFPKPHHNREKTRKREKWLRG